MSIKNIFLRPILFFFNLIGSARLLQRFSDGFWFGANNTYFASEEFYLKRESVIRETLSGLPALNACIDLGCGDGRFTKVIRDSVSNVKGYDLSAELINIASTNYGGINGLDFIASDVTKVTSTAPVNLVTCFGLVTCLVDDDKVRRLACVIDALLAEGGYLILIDTLSRSKRKTRLYRNGYIGCHRSDEEYCAFFYGHGLDLVSSECVVEVGDGLFNSIFVFRKRN